MLRLIRAATLAACIASAWPALADGAGGEELFKTLNTVGREAYGAARAEVIPPDQAIFVVTDKITLFIGDTERGSMPITALVYTQLKSISHIALGVFGACKGLMAHPMSEEWLARFEALRSAATEAKTNLPVAAFDATQRDRLNGLLDRSIEAINAVLAEKACNKDQLHTFMRANAPILLANANDAVVAQIDMMDMAMNTLSEQLTPQQSETAIAVITGPKMPRIDNAAAQYFEFRFNEPPRAEQRVIYTEGVYDIKGALGVLRVVLFDRDLSKNTFDDKARMDRDLLGDGAKAYLLKRFGKLGAQSPD